jgi:hypothetical protein
MKDEKLWVVIGTIATDDCTDPEIIVSWEIPAECAKDAEEHQKTKINDPAYQHEYTHGPYRLY